MLFIYLFHKYIQYSFSLSFDKPLMFFVWNVRRGAQSLDSAGQFEIIPLAFAPKSSKPKNAHDIPRIIVRRFANSWEPNFLVVFCFISSIGSCLWWWSSCWCRFNGAIAGWIRFLTFHKPKKTKENFKLFLHYFNRTAYYKWTQKEPNADVNEVDIPIFMKAII